jgi:hypothetical protein
MYTRFRQHIIQFTALKRETGIHPAKLIRPKTKYEMKIPSVGGVGLQDIHNWLDAFITNLK